MSPATDPAASEPRPPAHGLRRQPAAALLAGWLFGLGLSISGMVDPAKVLGFLDVAGAWDPTLAFVMGGALAVALPAMRRIARWPRPWLAPRFELPRRKDFDAPLVGGAALFGIGWGLAGFCPGPAIAALSSGEVAVYAFVGAMLAGFALHDFMRRPTAPAPQESG